MTDVTAIDVLVNPDTAMLELAGKTNARMLSSVPAPAGFALDEHHQPHITTLQRYVRTADLDRVFAAIKQVIDTTDLSSLTFQTMGIRHMTVDAYPGIGLTGIVVKPSPEILAYQQRLIDAVAHYTEKTGTSDAFVRTAAEPDINQDTIDYIATYVPDHSGDNFLAHVTVGLAKIDDLTAWEAEPFQELTFGPSAISVYQLGNNGTAAKKLTTWTT